jgi:hypothetical protein
MCAVMWREKYPDINKNIIVAYFIKEIINLKDINYV